MVHSLSRKVGILRKSIKIFNDPVVARKCFFSFLLPIFEYCSPVWGSAASQHLSLLDKVLKHITNLVPDLHIDLSHRRSVASLCMFYKIFKNNCHPVHNFFPPFFNRIRETRGNIKLNNSAFRPPLCRTEQFKRDLIPRCIKYWNSLPDDTVSAPSIQSFKLGVNSFLTGLASPLGP